MKPIWVFDGPRPQLKSDKLEDSIESVAAASIATEASTKSEGDLEEAKKMVSESIILSKDMNRDAKKMLELLGVPVIESPSEAQAQCATLVQKNLAFGTLSDDLDSLAFGSKVLIKGLTAKGDKFIQID